MRRETLMCVYVCVCGGLGVMYFKITKSPLVILRPCEKGLTYTERGIYFMIVACTGKYKAEHNT